MKSRALKSKFNRGFSLFEVLTTVSLLSVATTVGVVAINKTGEKAEDAKLRRQVTTLNAAIQTYEVSGGSLEGTATADGVINKLKTAAANAEQMAGPSESLVDLRLASVNLPTHQAGSSIPRAIWNPEIRRFVYAKSGANGVAEFILTDEAIPANAQTEVRNLSTEYASTDDWVWDYTDQDVSATGGASSEDSVSSTFGEIPTNSSDPQSTGGVAQLAPPIFTVPGGDYPYLEFVELEIGLENPNPFGSSTGMYYSQDGGPWTRYVDPFVIMEGTYIRAYAVTGDPLSYSDSEDSTQNYAVIWQTFTGGTRGDWTSATGPETAVVEAGRSGGNNGGGNNYDTVDSTNPNTILFQDPSGTIDDEIGYGESAGGAWVGWGTLDGETTTSSLTFTGNSFRDIDAEVLFSIGSLTFTNGSALEGTEIWDADLAMSIDFSTPNIQERFDFNHGIATTTTSGDSTTNSDSVYIDTNADYFQTRLNGVDYALQLEFGTFSGEDGYATLDEFHVFEGSTATAEVFGIFVAVENIQP